MICKKNYRGTHFWKKKFKTLSYSLDIENLVILYKNKNKIETVMLVTPTNSKSVKSKIIKRNLRKLKRDIDLQ